MAFGTCSEVELPGIAPSKACAVTAEETVLGNRKSTATVEGELLRNDFEVSPALLARKRLPRDTVWNISKGIWNLVRLWQVLPRVRITPRISPLQSLLLCEWKVLLRNRFIVGKRRGGDRKMLSPLGSFLHMFNDLRNKPLVLFPCVLLVEDAVLLPSQPTAAKEI